MDQNELETDFEEGKKQKVLDSTITKEVKAALFKKVEESLLLRRWGPH